MTEEERSLWYDQNILIYKGLANSIAATLTSLLQGSNIDFVAITHREKSKRSFLEKFQHKEYTSPLDMTDLAGIRVVAYIESDVDRVSGLLKKEFDVDGVDSLDKTEALGHDKVGYRSKHYICALNSARLKLQENIQFKQLRFEVQVRTVLQHAWAEIEHDRSYKYGGLLPNELRRRLFLVAGILELADREFDTIAKSIGNYSKKVVKGAEGGDLSFKLDSISVHSFLDLRKLYDNKHIFQALKTRPIDRNLLQELKEFGIIDLKELDQLLSREFLTAHLKFGHTTTPGSFLRRAMMFKDPDFYLSDSMKRDFVELLPSTAFFLRRILGNPKAKRLMTKAGLRVQMQGGGHNELDRAEWLSLKSTPTSPKKTARRINQKTRKQSNRGPHKSKTVRKRLEK